MAYDPQANRRRPKPGDAEPAPVDALLSDETASSGARDDGPKPEDPPPGPGVTPDPADPVPDKVIVQTGVAGAAAALFALLVLRWLWKRSRRSVAVDPAD